MLVGTDLELLERYCAAGEPSAMGELVRRHGGMVFGVAERITRNRDDAEDVAQSCFLELIRNAAKIRDTAEDRATAGSAAGWLHSAAVHRALDALRNNKTRKRHEREAARRRFEADATAAWWQGLSPLVDEAIAKLAPELREALVLHYLQG